MPLKSATALSLPIAPLCASLVSSLMLAGCGPGSAKVEHRWFGMDTDLSATLFIGSAPGRGPLLPPDSAFARLERESARLERVFSDYMPGSSLRALLGRKGDTLTAAAEILAVFRAAQEMSLASSGSFDITLHNLKDAWGLSSGATGRVPSDPELAAAMRGNPAFGSPPESNPAADAPFLLIDGGRLVLQRDSAVFDLGGIAKGFVIDHLHAILDSLGYPDHIVKAGGDMLLGGHKSRGSDPEPWKLGIRHPRNGDGVAGTLKLAAPLAVSTSGDYERFFMQDGVRYHHVFDPRTGKPARPYCSVTVLAANSLLADRLTKPLFILGPSAGARLLKQFGARAVWMRESGDGREAPDSAAAALCHTASEGMDGILSIPNIPPCP
jgi:thiamine biosynthesis lipoprotein